VLSVTSEPATLPAANAPSRPTRPEQTAAGDDFSALIDSATADPRNNDGPVVPPERPTRADAPSAPADNQRPEPSAQAPATAASQQDRERGKPAVEPGAGVACKPGKPEVNTAASHDAASDIATSDDGEASAAPTPSQQPVLVDASAVAVAIAAPVIATGVIAAPLPSATGSEPLAIAAAAIAISKSPLEAVKLSPGATPATTPSPAADAPEPAPAAVAPGAGPALANLASIKAVEPKAAEPATTVTAASAEQTTASAPVHDALPVAATIPAAMVTPKVAAKTPAAKVADTAAPSEPAGDDADAAATQPTRAAAQTLVAQAPAADENQKTGGIPVASTKPELPATDAPATPHERRPMAVQVQAESLDAGQPAPAVQQPAPSAAAPAPAPQLSVIASTSDTVPLNGLALQIAVTAQSGRSRFEIRLDPAELGRIDVRIDVDRHGQMTSHLTVEKPETLAMLRQDAPQLQRALDNAGFKTGDNGLQFSLRDQSSSGQNGGDQTSRNAQRLVISEDDGVAAAMAGRSYGRLSGSGGGVDIRV
jgi:flagellar hook-length control protein FliK